MSKPKKRLLIERLLAEGHFATAEEALPFLLGGNVLCGGQRVSKGGTPVALDAPIEVRGRALPFVGKGGLKLSGALDDFGLSPAGRVCVDAGASTGGFTDCLAQRGAALVYAVDVGFGQLAGSLRQNPRVVNLERTNVSDPSLRALSPRPTLGTVDLSYLSLRKAVPAFAEILHGEGDLVCLVKPLFEVDDPEARRTGVIDPACFLPLLRALVEDISRLPDTRVRGVTNSAVTGNAGTVEFFLHVALGAKIPPDDPWQDLAQEAQTAIDRALRLDKYDRNSPLPNS